MLKKVLPLLFFIPLSFSGFVLVGMDNFFAITAPVCLIVITLLAMTYMASKALSQPQLEAWTKLELREFIVGMIVILLVISIVESANISLFYLTGYDGDLTSYAVSRLTSFANPLVSAYEDAIEASHHLTLLSGYSFSYPVSAWYFSFSFHISPYGGYSSLIVMLYHATQGLTNAILIYNAAALFVDFFSKSAIVLLPFAMALRIIPFTRQAGTTLIALCLGAYFFFPFSVFLVSKFHDVISPATPIIADFSSMQVDIPLGFGELCKGWAKDFASIPGEIWGVAICAPIAIACWAGYAACFAQCWQFVTSVMYPMVVMFGQLGYGMMLFMANMMADKNITEIYYVLKPFLQAVNERVVLCYIDVIVIATITYVGVKSVSSALGGEYFLAGIQRLI